MFLVCLLFPRATRQPKQTSAALTSAGTSAHHCGTRTANNVDCVLDHRGPIVVWEGPGAGPWQSETSVAQSVGYGLGGGGFPCQPPSSLEGKASANR